MTGVLRRWLLSALIVHHLFRRSHPDTYCPLGLCDGVGYFPVADEGRTYQQECICAPSTGRR